MKNFFLFISVLITNFYLFIQNVLADACPPSGGSSGGGGSGFGGASGLFGGNMSGGGFWVSLAVAILFLFAILLLFLMLMKKKTPLKEEEIMSRPISDFVTTYSVNVVNQNGVTENQILKPGRNFIGRNESSAVKLDDPKASHEHAEIWVENGQYFINDLNSKNGTYVNGERITEQRQLFKGDRIQVGDSTIILP